MLKYRNINIKSYSKPLIIFDFDGVLCDSQLLFIQTFNDFSEKYKYNKIKQQDIESSKNMSAQELIKYLGIDSKLKLYRIVRKIKKKMLIRVNELKYFNEIDNLLISLNNSHFNLGVLTANSKYTVQQFLKINNLEYFDFIIGTTGLFNKKIYIKKIQKHTKIDPKNIFYIGDEVSDIRASTEANINSIAVTWGFNSKEILLEEKPNFIANTVQELKDIIWSV